MGFRIENQGTSDIGALKPIEEATALPPAGQDHQSGVDSMIGELRQAESLVRHEISMRAPNVASSGATSLTHCGWVFGSNDQEFTAASPITDLHPQIWKARRGANESTESQETSDAPTARGHDPNIAEAETRRRLAAARTAQAEADSLARAARGKNAGISLEAERAAATAQQKWGEVQKAVEDELRIAAKQKPLSPQDDPVARRAKEIGARYPQDVRFSETIMRARQKVKVENQAAEVHAAYKAGGPVAASKKLRELTAGASPEEAAQILTACKATTDLIVRDLAGHASPHASVNAPSSEEFKTIVADLSAVANHAAQVPGGRRAVDDLAASLVRAVSSDPHSKLALALGQAIGAGHCSELATSVAEQLQYAGRTKEAGMTLLHVRRGVDQLRTRLKDTAEKVKASNQELSWLVRNWGPMMTRKQLQAAVAAYKSRHPEYAELDRLGKAAISTANNLTVASVVRDFPHDPEGLPDGIGGSVRKSVVDLLGDEKVQAAVAQSPSAKTELARLMRLSQNGQETLLDHLGDISRSLGGDAAKSFRSAMFVALVEAAVGNAVAARAAGDTEGAKRCVAQLKQHAHQLGFDHQAVTEVVNQLGKGIAAKSVPEAKAAIEGLDRVLEKFGGVLAEGGAAPGAKKIEGTLRAAGLMLSTAAVAMSLEGAVTDPSPQKIAEALAGAAELGRGGTELVAAMLEKRGFLASAGFEATGKVIAGVNVALDGIRVAQNIAEGDWAEAGLYGASTAGGIAMLAGATGPGALIVAAAAVGLYQLNRVRDANQYEAKNNSEAAQFLLDGGIKNNAVAVELLNQDGDGDSPGPVLTALAERLGIAPQKMLDYLNSLSTEQVRQLVNTIHRMDLEPDEQGRWPATASNDAYVGPKPSVVPYESYQPSFDQPPRSLNGLDRWMQTHGYPPPSGA